MPLTPPLKRLTVLSLMLSVSALPLYAQMTPLKVDDGSKERRLELPPNLEETLRARDAIERSQRQEARDNEDKKAKENAPFTQNRPKKTTIREEKKQKEAEVKSDRPVTEETGLRPTLSDQNKPKINLNDRSRTNVNLGQGTTEENRQRETMLDESLPRTTRRIDINKGTPTPSITLPNQGPTGEVTRSPNMATLANSRTGKLSPVAIQKAKDKVGSITSKEKNETPTIKTNQALPSRKILRTEQVLITRNSRYAPLPRALPTKAMTTPIIVERQNERGRVVPNANPLAVGSIIHPLSGAVIPRALQTVTPVDLIGVYTRDMAVLRAPALDDKIFTPTGIKSGAFTVMPVLDVSAGYDSNFSRGATALGTFQTTIAPEFSIESDFARHAINAEIKGSFSGYEAYQSVHRPDLTSRVALRLDIQRDQRLDLDVRSRIGGQGTLPSSYTLATGVNVTGEPLAYTQGAGATYTKEFNRLIFSMRGTFDRTTYDDVSLSDNSLIKGAERNFNAVRGAVRFAVRVLEDFRPFVEVFSEQRMFDVPLRGTVEQGSTTTGAKAGIRFERPQRLMGELAVGTITRNNRDSAQSDISGLMVDGTLVWMASGLTNVTFSAKTAFDESVLTGVSSVYRREVGVQVDHALRRHLIASARFAYGYETYEGSARKDNRFNLTTALTYKLSRSVAVRGEYRLEKVVSSGSTTPVDYTANMLLVGLRLTR